MRKRVPSRLAVLVTLLPVVVGGLSVAFLLGTSVAGLAQKLPTYQARLTNLQETATTLLAARGLPISEIGTLEIFSPNRLVSVAGSVLGSIGNVLGDALLIIFLVAILLFEFAGRQARPGDRPGRCYPHVPAPGCQPGRKKVCGNHGGASGCFSRRLA
jgi:predicted PurR-regulated permease PerM